MADDVTNAKISVELEIQIPGDKTQTTPEQILSKFFAKYRREGNLLSSKVLSSTIALTKKQPIIRHDIRFENRLRKYLQDERHYWNYHGYDTYYHLGYATPTLNTIKFALNIGCPVMADRPVDNGLRPILTVGYGIGSVLNKPKSPRKFTQTEILNQGILDFFDVVIQQHLEWPQGAVYRASRDYHSDHVTVMEFSLNTNSKLVTATITQKGLEFLKVAGKPIPPSTVVQMSAYDSKQFEKECETIRAFLKDNFVVPVGKQGKEFVA
jgi:hypothetical protein